MMEINPHQVEHIKKSQPNFKFKERNIVLPKESKSKSKKKDSTRAKEPGAGVIASFDENEGNNYVGDYPAGNKSISPQFGDEQGKKTVKNPAVSMSSDSGDNIGELIKTPSFQSPNRGHLTQQISQSSMMSRQSSVMGSIDERESEDDEGRSRLTSQSDDKGKSFDDGDLINSISAYKNELSESIGEVNLAGSDPNNKTMDESISVDIVHPASQVSNDLQQQQYQHQALDESTILLLDRANWLIDRFQDAQKYVFAVHNSQKEHTQSSLELLSQPVNLSLLSKEPQEFAARGTANRGTYYFHSVNFMSLAYSFVIIL